MDAGLKERVLGAWAGVGELWRVSKLDLADNQLGSVPSDFLLKLSALSSLSLSHNALSSIPLGPTVHTLRHLSLSHNNIAHFPLALKPLQHLQVLDLSWNHISTLPPFSVFKRGPLGKLTSLSSLDLRSNALQDATPCAVLPSLSLLFLSDNPLISPPLNIIHAGLPALRQWVQERVLRRRDAEREAARQQAEAAAELEQRRREREEQDKQQRMAAVMRELEHIEEEDEGTPR